MGTLFAHLTPEPPKRPRRSLLFRDVPARLRADRKPAHPAVIKAFADISTAHLPRYRLSAAGRLAEARAWNALIRVVLKLPPLTE